MRIFESMLSCVRGCMHSCTQSRRYLSCVGPYVCVCVFVRIHACVLRLQNLLHFDPAVKRFCQTATPPTSESLSARSKRFCSIFGTLHPSLES